MKALIVILSIALSTPVLAGRCFTVSDVCIDENGNWHEKVVEQPCSKYEFDGIDFSKPDRENVIVPSHPHAPRGTFTIRGPLGDTTYVPQADGTLKATP